MTDQGRESIEDDSVPSMELAGFILGTTLVKINVEIITQNEVGRPHNEGIVDSLYLMEQILSATGLSPRVEGQIKRLKQEFIEKYEPSDSLSMTDSQKLGANIGKWEAVLVEDFRDFKSVPVHEIPPYDMHSLVDNPDSLFEYEVWRWLDSFVKDDITEACRSLAVNCPTASMMVSLRAVEYCLRQWYEDRTDESLEQSWGRVLQNLEKQFPDPSNRPPVLSNLDYLREKRNGIAHPDRSPSMTEAARTLNKVETTISEIYSEMN